MSRLPGIIRTMVLCCIAVAVTVITAQVGMAEDETVKDVIKVEVTGTLRTGLMAIGGETTGTVIVSNGVTWELDLSNKPDLQALAGRLSGKKVVVSGVYQRRRGIEIQQREIVTVTAMSGAKAVSGR